MTGRTRHLGSKRDRPRGVATQKAGAARRPKKGQAGIACGECGLVQGLGGWSYRKARIPRPTKVGLCPACTRVRDRYPAGTLTIPAARVDDCEELVRTILNMESTERLEHPLERVMEIRDVKGALVVTTTGVHLARSIAHKLGQRFREKARIRYADREELVRVDWVSTPKSAARTAVRR